MARGLIDVVTDLNSRGAGAVGKVGVPPDTGLEAQFKGVAQDFKVIGDQIGKMADHARQKEGDLDGKFAGLDPEFRTRRDGTIYGDAFDKAGLDIAETRLKQQLSSGIDGVTTKHAGDAQAIAKGISAVGGGFLANVPEELQPNFKLLIEGKRIAAMREAARQQMAQMQKDAHAAAAADVDMTLKGLHQKGSLYGLDPTADELLAGEKASLAHTMGRKGPNGKPLYTPDEIQKTLKLADETVAKARIWGTFDRLPSAEAKATFIKDFEQQWKENRGLASSFDWKTMQGFSTFLESELRRDRSELNVATRGIAHDLSLLQKRFEAGHGVNDEDLAALNGRVASAGTPEQRAALAEAIDSADAQRSFRQLRLGEMDAVIEQRRAELASGDPPLRSRAQKHLGIFEAVRRSAETELKNDPLGWADRTQFFKSGVAKLDFGDAAILAASLKARVAQGDELASHHGKAGLQKDGHVQYLRPSEVAALGGIMAKGGEGALKVASLIASAVPDQAEAILAQLGRHAPAMAQIGRLVAAGDPQRPPQVVYDALNGIAFRQTENGKKNAPKFEEATAQAAAARTLGDAYRTPAAQREMSAIVNVAREAYVARAQTRNIRDRFDDKLWDEVLHEAAGGRTVGGEKYGGVGKTGTFGWRKPIVVPADVKTDHFDRVIGALTDADFKMLGQPVDDKGRPFSMAQVRQSSLRYVAPGKYAVILDDGDPANPKWMGHPTRKRADGSPAPYILDLGAVMGELKQRRPDAFGR